MDLTFSTQDAHALYAMMASSRNDIIIKTDLDGYILHATPSLGDVTGWSDFGVARHFLEMVSPDARAHMAAAHAQAVAGDMPQPLELRISDKDQRKAWYEARLSGVYDAEQGVVGVLIALRDVDEMHTISERLFTATYTDPLTGLTNRTAFVSMLEHMLSGDIDGHLALFSIDFFRTINMQYGQRLGDEVLTIFADLLRHTLRSEDIISRIGSERFAVILPRVDAQEAEAISRRVVTTLANLRQSVGGSDFIVTVSASVARIADSMDSTINRAEMALFAAKAKGRNRLELEKVVRLAAN